MKITHTQFDKEEAIKCDFCNEIPWFNEMCDGYFIDATNDKEIELMEKRFSKFKDTPVLFCCEECMAGRCESPSQFFREEFKK